MVEPTPNTPEAAIPTPEPVVVPLTKVEQAQLTIANEQAKSLAAILELPQEEQGKALMALTKAQNVGAKAQVDKDVAELKETEDKARVAHEAFRTLATSVLVPIWKEKLFAPFKSIVGTGPIPTVKSFVFRVDVSTTSEGDKHVHTVGEPTSLVGAQGNQRKASTPSGNGGGAGKRSINVDGVDYPSSADAIKALLPDRKPQSYDTNAAALKAANHTVVITNK